MTRRLYVSATLAVFAVFTQVSALNIQVYSDTNIRIYLEDNAQGKISLNHQKLLGGAQRVLAVLGRNSSEVVTSVTTPVTTQITFTNDHTVQVTVRKVDVPTSGFIVSVAWQALSDSTLQDCFHLGTKNWYGGPQQKLQYWPIEKLTLEEYAYTTKEIDSCAIAEPYWLSSEGIFYFVDKRVPLFVSQSKNNTCFIAKIKAPYSSKRTENTLAYTIGIFSDVRQAHEYTILNIFHKPNGYPDERMITYPVWSTWARYKRDIDHNLVIKFADEITSHGFPNSQFEIDDLWEICYGSLTVDVRRFPDMKNTVDTLKAKGYRVTVWAHPFMNKGCEPWYTHAKNNRYLVFSENENVDTSWWNDNGTVGSYLDFTKSEVRMWYVDRLRHLQVLYGIDSYKFDGGETSFSPQIPVLQGDIYQQPVVITIDYVRAVSQFGRLVEVRTGYGTQDLPVFVRMIDKDTYWTFENGLPTLVTTMLQMNMNGYVFVLPDMIGGNGYNEKPSSELFIRWLQANTFMPSLQFSYVPWDYDAQTITISKQYVDLHAQYAPEIIKACQRAVQDGSPVNPPIWWIAPNDTTAHAIWDEYLLGEDILVAPVLEKSAVSRDIYLPAGTWLEMGNSTKVHEGPLWLRDFPAPLNVLPYFRRGAGNATGNATEPDAASVPVVSALLLVFGIWINLFY